MSIDAKMAWRNIWRNPRRTFLTVAAIAFACLILVFMLSFQFGSYAEMINSAVRAHTGYVQIQAQGYLKDKEMHRVIQDPKAVDAAIKDIPYINAFTSRANGFALISSKDRTYGVGVIGVEPEGEAKVSTIKSMIRKGDYLAKGDTSQAIIGDLLARNLQVGLGDELTLLGQGRDGSVAAAVLTVKGIYSSGQTDFDRSVMMIPLGYFQDTFFMEGAVHEIVILGRELDQVPVLKDAVSQAIKDIKQRHPLVTLDWNQIMPGLMQSIKMDLVSGLIIYFVLIVVVAFSILNTFLMAVLERTREFGVMMAVGVTPGRLTKVLLMESTAITLVGIITGMALGIAVTGYFQAYGINLSGQSDLLQQYGIPALLHPQLSWTTALAGPSAVLVITFIAALFPALRVRKLRPVEALTHV